MRFACLLLLSGLSSAFAGASAVRAEDAPVDCDGRNPLYCGPAAVDGDVAVLPPGGCEGRNPLYCRETAPPAAKPDEEDRGRERATDSSKSSHRNPQDNPHGNPNRRPQRTPGGSRSGG